MENRTPPRVENIVQFTDLLLLGIIRYTDNIDKVCFTLTCKDLFTRFKDKLWFTWSEYNNNHDCDTIHGGQFKLKSYYVSYQQSKQICHRATCKQQLLKLMNTPEPAVSPSYQEEKEFDWTEWKKLDTMLTPQFIRPQSRFSPPQHSLIIDYNLQSWSKLQGNIPDYIKCLELKKIRIPQLCREMFPPYLVTLVLNGCQPTIVPGALPHTLKHLVLSKKYNVALEKGSLPEGLEVLYTGTSYSHSLGGGILPRSLKALFLSKNQSINKGDLPDGLEILHIPNLNPDISFSISIPPNCKSLVLPYYHLCVKVDNLSSCIQLKELVNLPSRYLSMVPPNVTKLGLQSGEFDWKMLPKGLTTLELTNCTTNCVNDYPPNLRSLYLKQKQNNFPVPSHIKKLYVYCKADGFPSKLPAQLEKLAFITHISPLADILNEPNLPPTLKKVRAIGFSQPMSNLLFIPSSIDYVIRNPCVGSCTITSLPSSTVMGVRGISPVDELKYKDLFSLSHVSNPTYDYDIRRLSDWSFLLFSNSALSSGVLTLTPQELQRRIWSDNIIYKDKLKKK